MKAAAVLCALLSLTAIAYADDELFRPRPGHPDAYDPPTYCAWNRTGLPPRFQAICAARDKKNGTNDSFRWQNVEADNGAVYRIDLNHIEHLNTGAATAVIYAEQGGLMRWMFDCQGHYMDDSNAFGITLYAPPRSVAGRLSAIACAR